VKRVELDGPTRTIEPAPRCRQVYRVRLKVGILMRDGVPCDETFVVRRTTREPRLPFAAGNAGKTRSYS
jgi:hypothetical protein